VTASARHGRARHRAGGHNGGAWVQERPHGLLGRSVQPERHADGTGDPAAHTPARAAHAGCRAAPLAGHRARWWRASRLLALSTSAHHLAAAHADGLVPAQPSVKGWARVVGHGASSAVVSSHRTDHPAHDLPKYFVKNALGTWPA